MADVAFGKKERCDEVLDLWGPTLKDLTAEIQAAAQCCGYAAEVCDDEGDGCDDDEGLDVRLNVQEGSGWCVNIGSSDYDQDHRGFWGAGSLGADCSRGACEDLAADLLEQVAEDIATREAEEG